MTTPDKTTLVDAYNPKQLASYGVTYVKRWTAWMQAHPDADPARIAALMAQGEPPPDTAVSADLAAVSQWQESHPVASEIYWVIRSALVEADGGKRSHHHRAAVYFIHNSFPSKPERARLGLPITALELAELLGVGDKTLRNYRDNYPEIFSATQQTMQQSFLRHYYGRVYEALGETAIIIGKEGTADRRLFAQIVGDLGPSGSGDEPINVQLISYIKENRPDDSD